MARDLRLGRLRGNYASETRAFDVNGRVERTVAASGAGEAGAYTTAAETRLSYDGYDRVSQATVSVRQPDASVQTSADAYGYDDADRLTSFDRTGSGAATATYAWDDAGNLTGATRDGVATTYVADCDGRLVSETTQGQTTAYAYDTYGRRVLETTGEGVTTYTWDPMGRLVEIASEDATSTYSYGVTGMREYARVETSAGVTWTKSVWAGQRLVAELDSDGVRYDYLYAPDGTPVAVKVTGGTQAGLYCYHTDASGSVVAISKAAVGGGPVVATYSYGPFGEQTGSTGSHPLASRNPLRYRGYYADGATGLYYLPARYYGPDVARFLSKDPAPPSAGDPRSLNAYAYCMGDPVNASDPSGAIIDVDGDGRVGTEDVEVYAAAHRSPAAARAHARAVAAGLAVHTLDTLGYLVAGGVHPLAQAYPGGWYVYRRPWLGSDGGERYNIWGPNGKYYSHVRKGDGSSSTGSGSHSGGTYKELDPYDMPDGFPKLPGVRNYHQDEWGDWWDDEGNSVPAPPSAINGYYVNMISTTNPVIMTPAPSALPGPIPWPVIELPGVPAFW